MFFMPAQVRLLHQLYDLVARLYDETEGFLDEPADSQRWYDRGYANGMVKALREHALLAELAEQLTLDPEDVISGQEPMAWGKAYSHGLEMGYRETFEVLPEPQRADT